MKAVDFIVEYSDHYLFIEVKFPKIPVNMILQKMNRNS